MLTGLIREIHEASRGTYGRRRILAELVIGRQLVVNKKVVARIMSECGLFGLPVMPGCQNTGSAPVSLALRPPLVIRRLIRDACYLLDDPDDAVRVSVVCHLVGADPHRAMPVLEELDKVRGRSA